ncbi:MAG: adenylate/guanylate cyclase domain-containing protein [Myxococcota bacterium]
MWQLVINGPGYFDTTYDLPEGATTMGRADENDIVLSGDLVSRRHARFLVKGAALSMEDLGSRNGTQVNGQELKGRVALKPGDTVSVGENSLTIRQPAIVESASTDVVDPGVRGVKRFGKGSDIGPAVILAKDIRDSAVLRALDNVAPFTPGDSPFAETGETELRRSPSQPIAYDSLFLLYKVAERLAYSHSLQSFLEDTIDRVMERANATTAVVLLWQAAGGMVPAAVRHRGKLAKNEVPVSDAIIEAALAQRAALVVGDASRDKRFAQRESVILYGVDQVMCVPIGQNEPYTGVLYLNMATQASREVGPLLDLCTAVAHLIAAGVEKFQSLVAEPQDRLRRILERYHAPDIAALRAAELGRTAVLTQMEQRTATVLFADIAGFSTLAQKLSPAQVVELLNEFYQRMTRLIFSFEGTVDKFLGDAVMALFGAPYAKSDDPLRAVRTAIALRAEWNKAMLQRPTEQRTELKIGLSTGSLLSGIVGSEARVDFTAVGEVVNVAAWLSASAAPGQILITTQTLSAVAGRFDVRALGGRPLHAAKAKVQAFEVIAEDTAGSTSPGVRETS